MLFKDAVESLLQQSDQSFGLVVIEDGSATTHRAAYDACLADLASKLGDRLTVRSLNPRRRGHGRSFATNTGAALAQTRYLAFLDDDDTWSDAEHLARVRRIIDAHEPDIVMSNQRAWLRGRSLDREAWLSGLEPQLRAKGRHPDALGAFDVSVDDLMAVRGFCHMNTLVVRRALFDTVGGMDETIRWEHDRDLVLRLCDRSERIIHHPAVVARHNVPDPDKVSNLTTAMSMIEKRLDQLIVLNKAALFAQHPAIRAHGRQHKGYVLKQITEELAASGRWRDARWFAAQALGAAPTAKWMAFALYCLLRGSLSGVAGSSGAPPR
jgi:glycosyltransferase involved in cell wall biosynthesis